MHAILVGFDGSDSAVDALRQALRLRAPGARLTVIVVVELGQAVHAGQDARRVADELLEQGHAAAERTREELEAAGGDADVRVVEGKVAPSLLEIAREDGADLLAVGMRGRSRAVGIVLGGAATTAVHDAPCSVLVARPAPEPERFPRTIAVGVDGSEHSARAAEVARALAEQLGATLRVVVAEGGKGVDREAVSRIAPDGELVPGRPVDVLIAAAGDADLAVLGSRGLHGVGALGSVGERVAHRASCSVLVVR